MNQIIENMDYSVRLNNLDAMFAEYSTLWGPRIIVLGSQRYCRWGPASARKGATCPQRIAMPNGADLLPHLAASRIDPEGVVDDPVHGCRRRLALEHCVENAVRPLRRDMCPSSVRTALSGGGFRQRPPHTGKTEPAMLVHSLATPIGFSWAIAPSPARPAHGTGTATCRRPTGSQRCRWWLPWGIFAFSRNGPHWQYCWPPQEQIFICSI